jgi:hypothetical protein
VTSVSAAASPPRIVDIDAELVDRAARFLHEHMNSRFSVATWRSLFEYPWVPDRPSSGVALLDGDRVVGVLGCVYSRRSVDSGVRTFCNICAWTVLPEFRRYSLSMLFHATRREGLVVTNLTPTPPLERVFRALHYEILDTHKLFLFPLMNLRSIARRPEPRFVTDLDEIERRLDGPSAVVFRDHRAGICRHLLATSADEMCYVLFRRRVKPAAVFAEALHVGNPGFFGRHVERFVWEALRIARAPALAVDSRFLAGVDVCSLPVRRTSFYLGDCRREGIDNAYTELSVFPV